MTLTVFGTSFRGHASVIPERMRKLQQLARSFGNGWRSKYTPRSRRKRAETLTLLDSASLHHCYTHAKLTFTVVWTIDCLAKTITQRVLFNLPLFCYPSSNASPIRNHRNATISTQACLFSNLSFRNDVLGHWHLSSMGSCCRSVSVAKLMRFNMNEDFRTADRPRVENVKLRLPSSESNANM